MTSTPTTGANELAPFRPQLWMLALTLLALCAFWACAAPFIGESNGGVLIILLSVLVAWPLLSWMLIAKWGGASGLRLGFSVLIVPVTLVGLGVLFRCELEALTYTLHRFPPPRPMFRNDFVDDERTLLPYWYPPIPAADSFGHWAWADYEDNVLVVVVTGVPVTSRVGALNEGITECTIKVGDDREDRFVTLKRTRDALVVVLPNGDSRHFALGSGLAKQFHRARESQVVENALREAGDLLDPKGREDFDEFLADYKEPAPL